MQTQAGDPGAFAHFDLNRVASPAFVVDEAAFLERFPSGSGYRLFLAEAEDADGMRGEIQKSLADTGVTVEKSLERLEAFHGVENTYIAIFHLLGGLGVVLATDQSRRRARWLVACGVVVMSTMATVTMWPAPDVVPGVSEPV